MTITWRPKMCEECGKLPATTWLAAFGGSPERPERCDMREFGRDGCSFSCGDCCDVYEVDDAELIVALWRMAHENS